MEATRTAPKEDAMMPKEHVMALTQALDGSWKFETTGTLTDDEAAALTFLATPAQVRLNEYVEVVDAGGTRIGNLTGATLVRYPFGPPQVKCSITLM